MKMKLFASFTSDKTDIEKKINVWLEEHSEVKVLNVKQSCYYSFWGASPLFITVWYETPAGK
jgi:hypothetical protein